MHLCSSNTITLFSVTTLPYNSSRLPPKQNSNSTNQLVNHDGNGRKCMKEGADFLCYSFHIHRRNYYSRERNFPRMTAGTRTPILDTSFKFSSRIVKLITACILTLPQAGAYMSHKPNLEQINSFFDKF
jgi:hypothetical protein